MSTVTQRIKEIDQPRGGYINLAEFDVKEFYDGKQLNENENVHASIIGMVVDYMTRYLMGTNIKKAFQVSIKGSICAEKLRKKGAIREIQEYINGIKGLDDESIINACKAVTFDVWYRNPRVAITAKGASETNPDSNTIENVRILINRSINFWNTYGPIKKDGFTFEGGGYTDKVNSGDGDFLTKDTLWDFKVSTSKPKSDNTLQIVMYYIMGKHSGKTEFNNINKVGIFNPRLNIAYIKNVDEIPKEVINEIESNVIGYKDTYEEIETTDIGRKMDMSELMRHFKCSRYQIMKMYAERDLPLIKENNKYYISEYDLNMWEEKQKKIQKQRMIITLVIMILIVLIFVLRFREYIFK